MTSLQPAREPERQVDEPARARKVLMSLIAEGEYEEQRRRARNRTKSGSNHSQYDPQGFPTPTLGEGIGLPFDGGTYHVPAGAELKAFVDPHPPMRRKRDGTIAFSKEAFQTQIRKRLLIACLYFREGHQPVVLSVFADGSLSVLKPRVKDDLRVEGVKETQRVS